MTTTRLSKKMLVPDVSAIAREMTSGSQISLIIRRVRKLPFSSLLLLGMYNITYLPLLVKKDFATGIKLLCELEILASPVRRRQWVLHNQMVDMAIALGNTRMLASFFDLAETYSFTPGLATYNPERCIQMLSGMRNVPKNLVFNCPKSSASLAQFAENTHLRMTFIA